MNTTTSTTTAMTAAQNLMNNRQAIKALEEQKEQLRNEFAAAIIQDAIEAPSRIIRLDTYWRAYGFLSADVFSILNDFLQQATDPAYASVKVLHHPIQRHYMEFDEQGNPTGNTITRKEEVAVMVNLGEVKPPRTPVEGEQEEPFMGAASLIDTLPLCKNCSLVKGGRTCPEYPARRWKCYRNETVAFQLTKKILAQL